MGELVLIDFSLLGSKKYEFLNKKILLFSIERSRKHSLSKAENVP